MSQDGDGQKVKSQPKAEPKPADAKPAEAKVDKKPEPAASGPLDLEERRLGFDEIKRGAAQLSVDSLVGSLIDGRAYVRANAALGLAALGHAAPQLVPLLRDSEAVAANATADALTKLGRSATPLVPAIVAATAGTQPEITDKVVALLAELVGAADDELIIALDVPTDIAMKSVIAACGTLGKRGIAFLIRAAKHERSRVRINAVAGLGKLGKADLDVAMEFLTALEATDPVPDVRTAAKQASLQVIAREKQVVVDRLPKNIPDFEARKLSASELAEYDKAIDIGEMTFALHDGRAHVKINAARALAVKGAASGAEAATAMGLNLRDSIAAVRKETAKALGKLGDATIAAANDLAGALGDAEEDVAEAAAETLGALGSRAEAALVKGLETGSEDGGRRVGELLAKLPNAPALLVREFASPAVNVQVNAARAMGLITKQQLGDAAMQALYGARTGGDARTRDAVRGALDRIEPRGATGPRAVAIEGFETRALTAADLDKGKAELTTVGPGDLAGHLQDGRELVRGNAALALGVLGAPAAFAARALGVLLRDDVPRVRMSAAQALDKIGDAAVLETADDLVGALGDRDDKVAETVAGVIRARKGKMIAALVRGLETDKVTAAQRTGELLGQFDDAADILCDAFDSPAVNVQVNAALGLGMLGPKRVGKGRKALEGARTGGDARTREAVRAALEVLDGPKRSGPEPVAVDGFETKLLGAEAFTDPSKLRLDDLVGYAQDGRAVVRANAATAIGSLGANGVAAAVAVAVLLRDDDMRVRGAAAQALDKLGDDAVRETASYLVGALGSPDPDVCKVVAGVLAARKARMLTALLKGLETDNDEHAKRILALVGALPDSVEILCDALDHPAENVQVNAAIGIGMLGAKKAGGDGKKALESRRTGGFVRTREAAFKGLAMLKE
ncbi:MAG TPA: HEAT repeat domain-containing protein [Kofleriaceae bacterium]|jgi:HEAT repeat protein|nr:HEAT repeat domain-containing protein [Kofleriaceae bacterium]